MPLGRVYVPPPPRIISSAITNNNVNRMAEGDGDSEECFDISVGQGVTNGHPEKDMVYRKIEIKIEKAQLPPPPPPPPPPLAKSAISQPMTLNKTQSMRL